MGPNGEPAEFLLGRTAGGVRSSRTWADRDHRPMADTDRRPACLGQAGVRRGVLPKAVAVALSPPLAGPTISGRESPTLASPSWTPECRERSRTASDLADYSRRQIDGRLGRTGRTGSGRARRRRSGRRSADGRDRSALRPSLVAACCERVSKRGPSDVRHTLPERHCSPSAPQNRCASSTRCPLSPRTPDRTVPVASKLAVFGLSTCSPAARTTPTAADAHSGSATAGRWRSIRQGPPQCLPEQLSRVVDEKVKHQAATSSSVVVSSSVTLMPSLNFTPASTSVTSSWPLNRRQRSWAASRSL